MTAEKYIGLDVHQATISLAVMDSKGKVVMESILETKATTILEFLAKIDKVMLQTHLNDLAKTLSHARVQHARLYFKAIFE
jgi:hypothetical protein